MTQYLVLVAMLLAIIVIRRSGLQAAFLYVFIPFFLAMPFGFWVHPGIPNTNFAQAALMPIVAALVFTRAADLRVGRLELLLAIYIVIRVVCDYLGRGYKDAQNYTFFLLTMVVGPYLLGRYMITSRRMDIATAKIFVLMFIFFFPMFLYEAKFWVSPIYQVFSRFFPDAGSGLSLRWGIARTAGTFEHPILACIMIIVVYRLHRWLSWEGEWDRPQTGLLGWLQRQSQRIPIAFKSQIAIMLIVMAIMTISRGPWIGGFAGAAVAAAGNFTNRKRALIIILSILAVAAIVGQVALTAYITPEEGEVLSGEAQTMLYRKVMIDQYQALLMDKLWTGWGLTTVPKIKGMESVDNAFFLMALQHGVLAPAVFAIIFLYAIGTQLWFGLKAAPGQPPIGFTFAGIYVMCFIAFSTVYMGSQTEPMLFLLLGWGESVKNRPAEDGVVGPIAAKSAPPFRRVMT